VTLDAPSAPPPAEPEPPTRTSTLIQREIVLVAALSAIAVIMFFVTRAFAGWDRAVTARTAAHSYLAGQRLAAQGRVEEAIRSLRDAAADEPDNIPYALDLARALTTTHRAAEARRILLTLRESNPEDGAVNLELARLTAQAGEADESVRYYHNAIYGVWNGSDARLRQRDARRELVQVLLAAGNRSAALSELLALTADMPSTAAAETELASLFARAGDHERAFEHFRRAIDEDSTNQTALAGAGEQAFALRDYTSAIRYLSSAENAGAQVQPLLDVARLVRSADPLSPHLQPADRVRRLAAALDHLADRLRTCEASAAGQPPSSTGDLQAAVAEVAGLQAMLQHAPANPGHDVIVDALAAIARAETAANLGCGPPAALDRALLEIGRIHGGEQ